MTPFLHIVFLSLVLVLPLTASAQQTPQATFYLDRLQVAGAPGDGVGVWRPQSRDGLGLYGQLGLGYSLNPFRVENYVDTIDQSTIMERQEGHPVPMQLTMYATTGVTFLTYFAAQASFPLAVEQTYSSLNDEDAKIHVQILPEAVVPMDARLDVRVGATYPYKTSQTIAFGAMFSLWLPTGAEYSFGGDTTVSGAIALAVTYDPGPASITINTGYHFRPRVEFDTHSPSTKLNLFRIADELTFGAALFVPLPVLEKRLRLSIEVTGSAGVGFGTLGDVDNAPIEWRLEGRGLLGPTRQFWISGSAGTRLSAGYAPDCRGVLLFGGSHDLEKSP